MPIFMFLNHILLDLIGPCPCKKKTFRAIARPDTKLSGERSWIPISKIVWHFTIGSSVWLLELSEVEGEVFMKQQ